MSEPDGADDVRDGWIHGARYVFKHAGDALPEHDHTGPRERLLHDVTVIRGRVEVVSPGVSYIGKAGDTIVFNGRLPHTVRALEDDSETYHRLINGPVK